MTRSEGKGLEVTTKTEIVERLGVTSVLLQTALLLAAAWFGFHIKNEGSYLAFTALVVFGTATFIAMGFALSSFASTVETYGAVSNLAIETRNEAGAPWKA